MLRVLKVCTSFNNFQALHPQLLNFHRKKLKCSLCNEITEHAVVGGSVFHLISNYSTGAPAHLLNDEKRKRKNRRKTAKYTDLLEVSEEKTSERKTKIKRLNAKTLHKIQGDDLKFDESLHEEDKLISKSLALEQLEQIGLQEEELEEKHDEIKETELEHIEEIQSSELVVETTFNEIDGRERNDQKGGNRFKPSKVDKNKIKRQRASDIEKITKEKDFNGCLVSYIELCMNCGFLNRGWYTVNYYLTKTAVPLTDIRIFNTLLEGFAKSGKYDRLLEIWQKMSDVANLKPNSVSFARRLEAIVRSTKKDKSDLLHLCFRLMDEQGITVNDIFKDTEWKRDSREIVIKAINAIRPNFSPKRIVPSIDYDCKIINHLNQTPTSPLTSPAEGLFSVEELHKLFREQFDIELKSYVNIKSIDAEKTQTLPDNVKFYRKQLEKLEAAWDKSINEALIRDISSMCALNKNLHKNENPITIYPYLTVLNRNEYVDIIKHEVRKLAMGSETYSPTAAILCRDLGNLVKMRYDIKVKQSDGIIKKVEQIYSRYLKWYLNPRGSQGGYNSRQTWQIITSEFEEGPSLDSESELWTTPVLTAIGKFLYKIILRDVKIDVNILKQNSKTEHLLPGFYTIFRYQSNSSCEEVKPHPVLSRLFRQACMPHLVFSAADLPMLSPPLPWSSIRTGGYILAKAPIIRLPSSASSQRERLKEAPPNQLYPCLDSLNQLGSIPWRVNSKILDIVVKLFNEGGNEKLNVPPPPPPLPPISVPDQSTKLEKYEAFKNRMLERRRRAEMYSLWCDALYRLSLANHFRDRIFWLPHNMDFRGRVYPCPPHLSHLGSDLYRSLLVFAQKQPLGQDGLKWLKLHAINLTGLKKRDSIAERLQYAEEVLPKILESANDPMKEGSWWMESEEPWQTLAVCLEIRDALQAPGGPSSYLSSFPVHQDGSCNGLQHYAALGRDAAGAASVNLAPSPYPQDVYSCVAAIVDRERVKDAANGDKVAIILDGFVRRKVIKQTVMTTVYGVTRFGARLQIAKQLKDIDDFPKEYVWAASQYLVVKTFDSIREMFTSTREIQDWFTEAAHLISGVRGESVEYVTPLGLPVVQPYSRITKIPLTPSGKSPANNKFERVEKPNIMKQKNAFPPNFIHSLDSSHMMLTSLHCQRAGITFVSVHDCYWTHPSTVNIMNKICREQFVSLHSQPILEDLSNFMVSRYAYDEEDSIESNECASSAAIKAQKRMNAVLRKYPSKGDFNIENVLDSVYFFS